MSELDGATSLTTASRHQPAHLRDRRGAHRHRAGGGHPGAHRLLHRDQPPPGRRRREDLADRPGDRHPVRHLARPRVGGLLRAGHRRRRLRGATCSAAARSSCRCSPSRSPAPACSPRSASSSRWTPSARSPTTPRASPRCPATSTAEGAAVLTSLDAVGNTTKAITKGIAIATAVLAATALFGSFTRRRRHARWPRPASSAGELSGVRPAAVPGLLDVANPQRPRRPDHRRVGRVPLLRPRDQRGVPRRRRGHLRGAPPVPRAPRDHGRHRAAGVRHASSTSSPATRCASSSPRACSPS